MTNNIFKMFLWFSDLIEISLPEGITDMIMLQRVTHRRMDSSHRVTHAQESIYFIINKKCAFVISKSR